MTLDFYSGALIAIDSAKTLGLNIDVKILDSQENKSSTSISSSFAQANLKKADVIVGPFYQTHAEKTAELLNGYIKTKQLTDLDSYIVPPSLNDNQGVLGCLKLAEEAFYFMTRRAL